MGILDFNNSGSSNKWNCTNPNEPNYMPSITGTVVAVKEMPKLNFVTKKPEYWDDGNVKLNVALTIQGQSGRELDWIFSPKSVAADACKNALAQFKPDASGYADLGGLMVTVSTREPQQGERPWGQGNPRPWAMQILGQGNVPFRGVFPYVPQQNAPAPQVANDFAAPAQPVMQPQPMAPQPAQQPMMQQQPVAQPAMQQPAAMPAAQAMQQGVAWQDQGGAMIYDQDIPF